MKIDIELKTGYLQYLLFVLSFRYIDTVANAMMTAHRGVATSPVVLVTMSVQKV